MQPRIDHWCPALKSSCQAVREHFLILLPYQQPVYMGTRVLSQEVWQCVHCVQANSLRLCWCLTAAVKQHPLYQCSYSLIFYFLFLQSSPLKSYKLSQLKLLLTGKHIKYSIATWLMPTKKEWTHPKHKSCDQSKVRLKYDTGDHRYSDMGIKGAFTKGSPGNELYVNF